MNLTQNPTVEQLRALIAACDDDAGHHILWVSRAGQVHFSRLPPELSPIGFEARQPDLYLRYETFECGNGYVGEEAADDEAHVNGLFRSLVKEYAATQPARHGNYIDIF